MPRLGSAQSTYTTRDVRIASDNDIVNDPSEFSFYPPTQYSDYDFDQLDSVDIRSPYQIQHGQAWPSAFVYTETSGTSNTTMGSGTQIYWGNHPDHNGAFLAQLLGQTGIINTTTISRSAVVVSSPSAPNINYSITAFSENYSQKWMYLEKYGGPLSVGDTVTFTPTDDNVVINTGNYTVNYDGYYTLGLDANNYSIQLTSNSSYPGGSGHGVPKGVKVTIDADWTIYQGGVPHAVLFHRNPSIPQ